MHGPVALVFYHLGAPDRSQLFMSPEISAVISQDQQDRTLRAAIVEALEKSGYTDKCSIGLDVAASEFKVKGEDGKVSSVPVAVGAESNGQIVVLSGLMEGQIVITPEAATPKGPEKK